jgi:hypothetical protein
MRRAFLRGQFIEKISLYILLTALSGINTFNDKNASGKIYYP